MKRAINATAFESRERRFELDDLSRPVMFILGIEECQGLTEKFLIFQWQ